MKKKTLGHIVLCTFALCMVSTCLLSGTLARFASTYTGTGTVNVASWTSVSFNGGEVLESDTFTFDLATTKVTNGLVNESYVAPGDTGSFSIELGMADVDYTYSIQILPATGNPVPVKFSNEGTEIVGELEGEVRNSEIDADGTSVIIDWEWVTAATDIDTSYEGNSQTFQVVITARQKLASDPVEP